MDMIGVFIKKNFNATKGTARNAISKTTCLTVATHTLFCSIITFPCMIFDFAARRF